MIAPRLVRLIETHSDQLTAGLIEKLQKCPRVAGLQKVPADEFKQRVHEIYHNLGEWLLTKTEADVERRYTLIGTRRAQQGVALSELLWAIILTKEHLWEYLKGEGFVDQPVELLQEIELFHMVDQFFERALFYATVGYEKAKFAGGGPATRAA